MIKTTYNWAPGKTSHVSCCDSCNNSDRNQRKKIHRTHIGFIWFGNVPASIGSKAQCFTKTEIRLHRRVFIIILNMTKLQKIPLYPEHTIPRP